MIIYNQKGRKKPPSKELYMTKAEAKLIELASMATEPSTVCLPKCAKVLEATERALLVSGKDSRGAVFDVIFLKNGRIDFFVARTREEADLKLLVVA